MTEFDTSTVTVTQTKEVKRRPARSKIKDAKVVAAVDVTTTVISVCIIGEDGVPATYRYQGHKTPTAAVHTVSATMHRIHTAVKAVADLVTQEGTIRPATVALVKGAWGPMSSDPSAFRRAGIWWGIAAELDRLRIPTAELPLFTVQKWAMDTSAPGRKGTDALTDWVGNTWTHLPAELENKPGYRASTVAVAAAAAMACGIETAVPVTQERLNLLRGYADETKTTRNNKAIQWSIKAKPAKNTAEFAMKKMGA